MCFFGSTPKKPDVPPVTVQADAKKAAATGAEELAKMKANSNNPNISTSPFGDTTVAAVDKKTLLGA